MMMMMTSTTSRALLMARATTTKLVSANGTTPTGSRTMSQPLRFLSSSTSLRSTSGASLSNGGVPCSFPLNRALTTTSITRRSLSSSSNKDDHDDSTAGGSHSDFAAKRKMVPDQADEALRLIAEHVRDNPVMLYMKGTPSMPMCGFSAKVVAALKKSDDVDFASVNVLDYPSIRDGVKKFSDWPTIPQLYVNGEFIGGCDIVMSMQDSGELKELLQSTVAAATKSKE